jgi:hypothetical protein
VIVGVQVAPGDVLAFSVALAPGVTDGVRLVMVTKSEATGGAVTIGVAGGDVTTGVAGGAVTIGARVGVVAGVGGAGVTTGVWGAGVTTVVARAGVAAVVGWAGGAAVVGAAAAVGVATCPTVAVELDALLELPADPIAASTSTTMTTTMMTWPRRLIPDHHAPMRPIFGTSLAGAKRNLTPRPRQLFSVAMELTPLSLDSMTVRLDWLGADRWRPARA